ncbi:MAG: hypothetical protein HY707_13625 [Ignavibacteriae bacterium]|nr:hypothetical protein [Ignavibacteriota bacterium]
MKKGKRIKPKFPIEYRLLITPKYNERTKETVTLVALRTVNEFSNFRYELVVEPEFANNTLRLNIHGLRAPQLTLPESGPALFQTEYSDLIGAYTIIVSKLDQEENAFSIKISNEKVTVEKSPNKKFVEIVTKVEEW